MDYGGIPDSMRCKISPEVFDYMIEVRSEPCFSYKAAVTEIIHAEAFTLKSLEYTAAEFPGMEEVLLSSGTLYKPADISEEHIPEIWGKEKKAYLTEMVNPYQDSLTPQGMHDSLSLPESLLFLQYKTLHSSRKKGYQGFVEFKKQSLCLDFKPHEGSPNRSPNLSRLS